MHRHKPQGHATLIRRTLDCPVRPGRRRGGRAGGTECQGSIRRKPIQNGPKVIPLRRRSGRARPPSPPPPWLFRATMKGLSQLPAAVQQVRTRLYSPNFDVGRFSAELLMAHTAAKALGVARDPFLVIVIFRTNRQTVRQRGGGRERLSPLSSSFL